MSADAELVPALPTADLADKYIGSLDDALAHQQQQQPEAATAAGAPPPRPPRAVPRGAFRSYGPVATFAGRAHVVACFGSNAAVRAALETPGRGRVLVVKVCSAQAARRCAFLGDHLAALAVKNGWAGVVVAACVRDSAAMRAMPGLGVVALGTCPLKSSRLVPPGEQERAEAEAAEGVDLRGASAAAAAAEAAGGAGPAAVGVAGWAVVREGDCLYVDEDGFVISDRVLEL